MQGSVAPFVPCLAEKFVWLQAMRSFVAFPSPTPRLSALPLDVMKLPSCMRQQQRPKPPTQYSRTHADPQCLPLPMEWVFNIKCALFALTSPLGVVVVVGFGYATPRKADEMQIFAKQVYLSLRSLWSRAIGLWLYRYRYRWQPLWQIEFLLLCLRRD